MGPAWSSLSVVGWRSVASVAADEVASLLALPRRWRARAPLARQGLVELNGSLRHAEPEAVDHACAGAPGRPLRPDAPRTAARSVPSSGGRGGRPGPRARSPISASTSPAARASLPHSSKSVDQAGASTGTRSMRLQVVGEEAAADDQHALVPQWCEAAADVHQRHAGRAWAWRSAAPARRPPGTSRPAARRRRGRGRGPGTSATGVAGPAQQLAHATRPVRERPAPGR